jgi:hypothetical protein
VASPKEKTQSNNQEIAMRILASLLLLSATLTIHAQTPQGPDRQHGTQAMPIGIHYGDSQLRVVPPFVARPRGETLHFALRPDRKATDPVNVNYENVRVSIYAKRQNEARWLAASGIYRDIQGNPRMLTVPIPADAALQVHEYIIYVEKVGTLDPRVEVEPN